MTLPDFVEAFEGLINWLLSGTGRLGRLIFGGFGLLATATGVVKERSG